MTNGPIPFQAYESGIYLHGTKAELAPGELLIPGQASNYEDGRTSRHVYVSETLDGWTGHTPEQIHAMRDGLDDLRRRGIATILD